MREVIAAVIVTVATVVWAEVPLAQATLKTHYKGGKTESRRVMLARQPDGAWRFELNGRPTFYYTDYKDLAPIKRMYDLWQPLKHLQFEFLDDHAEIAPDVFRSRYSNGEEVVCNYTDKPFAYRGESVAPLAYRLYK